MRGIGVGVLRGECPVLIGVNLEVSMGHKIVAFRVSGIREGVKIDALTQSLRGTTIFLATKQVKSDHKDREAFQRDVEVAIKELIVDASQ